MVVNWRKLVQKKVDPKDRAVLITAMLREAHLKGQVAEKIRAMAHERPPENSWDIFNYMTYASSHLLEAPKDILSAMGAAAGYAAEETHQRMCPVCKRTQ